MPASGADHGRAGPWTASTTIAETTNAASIAISAARTTKPARAATPTPARLSEVVIANAAMVNAQAGIAGTSAWSAIPENRYATDGMSR